MANPLKDIYNSFKKGSDGLSGRKLSAFWAIVIAASLLSWKNTTPENAATIIGMWLLFGAVCLGLVTIPELIETLALWKKEKDKSE